MIRRRPCSRILAGWLVLAGYCFGSPSFAFDIMASASSPPHGRWLANACLPCHFFGRISYTLPSPRRAPFHRYLHDQSRFSPPVPITQMENYQFVKVPNLLLAIQAGHGHDHEPRATIRIEKTHARLNSGTTQTTTGATHGHHRHRTGVPRSLCPALTALRARKES